MTDLFRSLKKSCAMDIKKICLAGALLGFVPVSAQESQSFQEFRQKILDDYQEFRKTILAHYADFLNGTWHEYEPMMPLEKTQTPKPMRVPDVKVSKPVTVPTNLPKPVLADSSGCTDRGASASLGRVAR